VVKVSLDQNTKEEGKKVIVLLIDLQNQLINYYQLLKQLIKILVIKVMQKLFNL